ncbi:MAG: GtrA family protein [Ruminococcaceae bacterium]|nr:GtrA family protein [Oscillospiraceae bacterium]
MKEFFELLKKGKFKAIFLDPTDNGFLQFFRYLFVGGIATVVDVLFSFICKYALVQLTDIQEQIVYIISTTVGFTGGLTTNFLLSRAFVFGTKEARAKTKVGEFMGHFIVGAIGLGLSHLIIWSGTTYIFNSYEIFRLVAIVIVFIWNYLARKFFVYKK